MKKYNCRTCQDNRQYILNGWLVNCRACMHAVGNEYGITLNGVLMEKFYTPEEAYRAAFKAYDETDKFYAVVMIDSITKTILEED